MLYLSKTDTESLRVQIECARELETKWRDGREYAAGAYVRPSKPNGFEYECTTGGQTGSKEPRWPKTIAATKTDGSVTWTARAFATNASDTISSVNINAETGITAGAPTTSGTEISFSISSGTVGQRYKVEIEVTTAEGQVLEETLCVSVVDHVC